MCREVAAAKEIILAYLSTTLSPENLIDICDIRSGNKEILYNHIEALADIFTTAKEQLEKELLEKEGK